MGVPEVQTVCTNDKIFWLETYTGKIQKAVERISNEFMFIGLHLWEIRNNKWYEAKGYASIVEYAEAELHFKKRSTYNFIELIENFAEWRNNYPTYFLDDKYKAFGYSQLCEILSLAPEHREEIKPDMTIKQIREVKQDLKKDKVIDVKFKEEHVEAVSVAPVAPVAPVELAKVIEPVLKEDILKYLKDRLEVLRGCAKPLKEVKNDDFYLYLGGFNEVKFLIEEIEKDFR